MQTTTKCLILKDILILWTSKANFDLSLKQCYQLALAEIGLLTSDPCWVLLPIKTLWGPAGVDVVPILFWPLNTQLHSVCNFHFLSLCPFSLFSVCPSCSHVDLWVLFGSKDPVLPYCVCWIIQYLTRNRHGKMKKVVVFLLKLVYKIGLNKLRLK